MAKRKPGLGKRFVRVTASALLSELREIGAAIRDKAHGGYAEEQVGDEIVAVLVPPGGRVVVRVFTSLATDDLVVRDCGDDAIRIVLVAPTPEGNRPVGESIKMLRTAPRELGAAERERAFLDRFRSKLREAYALARAVPCCPDCGRAMAKRTARATSSEFFGCIAYPECRGTRPIARAA